MKTSLLCLAILCFLINTQTSCNHNKESNSLTKDQEDSIRYVTESLQFIRSVASNSITDSDFILVDKPDNLENIGCYDDLIADTVSLSKEDKQIIKQFHFKPLIKLWTHQMFPRIKILKQTTIDSIWKYGKGWETFYGQFGGSYNSFSAPIFLRNYTWCLFYTDDICGGLCGSGRVTLFKKKGDKWEEVKTWCEWIS